MRLQENQVFQILQMNQNMHRTDLCDGFKKKVSLTVLSSGILVIVASIIRIVYVCTNFDNRSASWGVLNFPI